MQGQEFRRLNSVAQMLTMSILFRRLNTGSERSVGKLRRARSAMFRRLNAVDVPSVARAHSLVRCHQRAFMQVQEFRRLNTGLERSAGKPDGTTAAVFRRLNTVDVPEAAVAKVRSCSRVRSLMSSLLFRRLNSEAQLPTTVPTSFRRLNTVHAGGVTDLRLFRRLNSSIALLKCSNLSLSFIHPYAQARTARCYWHVHTHGTGPLHHLNPAKCGVQCFWAPKGKHMR